MQRYFDPVPLLGDTRAAFRGQWPDRKWLNVPGPFYGADTDNCGTGRLHAPGHVLYEAEHWTPAAVREWWAERGRVREYLARHRDAWEADDERAGQGVAAAVREYAAYLDGELALDLRLYLFRLDERRAPGSTERLPEL
ncbi:ferredoxin [Streptomyces acidiscabies]|uniref:ferredoxin n=1 Tax=Streptomyces acidiscabies TaxID=42234 RepID=UPI000950C265|nr:ferredoxin [Streptomyces acidiscabies]